MEEVPEETRVCKNCKKSISAVNFELHSIHCKRNIKVCKICKEPVKISEAEKHLEEYHTSVPCKTCGEPHEKWMLPKHKEVCPKRLVACEFCGAEFPLDELSEHQSFCGSRTDRCCECHQRIMKKDYNAHLESHSRPLSKENDETKGVKQNKDLCKPKQNRNEEEVCPKRLILCEFCKEGFSRDELSEHRIFCGSRTESCFECHQRIMKKDYKAHLESHFRPPLKENEDNGVKEVNQNKLNEDLCKTIVSKHRKVSFESHTETPVVNEQLETSMLEGAVAPTPDKKKTSQKNYYHCKICQENIALEDAGTHRLNCADAFGKCRLCLKSVPPDEMPSHMYSRECRRYLEEFGMDAYDYFDNGYERAEQQSLEPCPHCKQMCSLDRIALHVEYCPEKKSVQPQCSQNGTGTVHKSSQSAAWQSTLLSGLTYECPLCNEQMPEDEKKMHESFYCKVLLSIDKEPHSLYSIPDVNTSNKLHKEKEARSMMPDFTSKEGFEACPFCLEKYSVHKIEKHVKECLKKRMPCKHCNEMILISQEFSHKRTCPKLKFNQGTESYAQVAKKPAYGEKLVMKKTSCVYCDAEIYERTREIHLQYCTAFNSPRNVGNKTSKYAHKNRFEVTGAVPKHSSYLNKGLPKMGTCKHCKTTYNADVLVFHEAECIHQRIECPDCYITFQLKDIEKHKCKGKKHKGDQNKTGGIASTFMSFLTGKTEPSKSFDDYQNKRNEVYQSHMNSIHYQDNYSGNEHLYFSQPFMEDAKIPCEFCGKPFPALEIVLHETGCKPEEVSYAKSVPEGQEKKTGLAQNEEVAEKKFFSVDQRRFVPSTKYETIKKRITPSEAAPGEFLSGLSRQSETDVIPDNKLEPAEKKSAPHKLQSVWNNDPFESEAENWQNPETQHEGEKMQQDENESEKDAGNDVEMQSAESDEEVSMMLDFITEKKSELSNMMDEKMEKLDCSEQPEEDDLNANMERGMSSPEIDSSEDVPVSRNNETTVVESVQPKMSCKLVNDSDLIGTKKQPIERSRLGHYKDYGIHLDEEETEFSKDVPVSRNSKTTVDESVRPKMPYKFVDDSVGNVCDLIETTKQRFERFKFDPYKVEHSDEEVVNEIGFSKDTSDTSESKEEHARSQKTVDNSKHEETPFQKAYKYILNAPLKDPEPSNMPVSAIVPKSKSGGKNNDGSDIVLHEVHEQSFKEHKSRVLEKCKSEQKVDSEDFPREGIPCEYCKEEVPCKDYDDHIEFCGSLTVKCRLCGKYIKKRDRVMHSQYHLKESEKNMKQDVTEKSYKKHLLEQQDKQEQNSHRDQLIKCQFCKVEVPLDSFLVHTDTCGSSGYQCKICKTYIKNRDRKVHSQMHSVEKEPEKKESAKQDIIKEKDNSEEMAKRYTKCKICHQTIAWIDLNTHIPNCASAAGKCSRCGDSVHPQDMKDHVLRSCPMLKQKKPVQNELSDQIERGRLFYENSVRNPHYKRQPQESEHNPKEVPTTESVRKPTSNSTKNPAFMLEPAESYSGRYRYHDSGKDSENNLLSGRRSPASYATTAENVEKWAKWAQKQ